MMGTAYSDSVDLKKEYYTKARQMCERGMYTNSGFKKLVDEGATIWDASSALTIREMEPCTTGMLRKELIFRNV